MAQGLPWRWVGAGQCRAVGKPAGYRDKIYNLSRPQSLWIQSSNVDAPPHPCPGDSPSLVFLGCRMLNSALCLHRAASRGSWQAGVGICSALLQKQPHTSQAGPSTQPSLEAPRGLLCPAGWHCRSSGALFQSSSHAQKGRARKYPGSSSSSSFLLQTCPQASHRVPGKALGCKPRILLALIQQSSAGQGSSVLPLGPSDPGQVTVRC